MLVFEYMSMTFIFKLLHQKLQIIEKILKLKTKNVQKLTKRYIFFSVTYLQNKQYPRLHIFKLIVKYISH